MDQYNIYVYIYIYMILIAHCREAEKSLRWAQMCYQSCTAKKLNIDLDIHRKALAMSLPCLFDTEMAGPLSATSPWRETLCQNTMGCHGMLQALMRLSWADDSQLGVESPSITPTCDPRVLPRAPALAFSTWIRWQEPLLIPTGRTTPTSKWNPMNNSKKSELFHVLGCVRLIQHPLNESKNRS